MNPIALNIGTSGAVGAGFSTINLSASGNWGSETADLTSYVLTNQQSPLDVQIVNLTTGNNQIGVPAAGGVFICPPLGNGSALILKGAAGDTGITISATAPTYLSFPTTPPGSFWLNSASTVTSMRLVWV